MAFRINCVYIFLVVYYYLIMNNESISDYKRLLDFWETTYANSQHQIELENLNNDNNWRELAPSEKFINALSSFSNCENVLDYGCGDGWGSIIMAKAGCKNIISVDLSKSAIKNLKENTYKYGVNNSIQAEVVSSDWINSENASKYDGFFCSNVIDVVPEEIADNILNQAHRIVKKDSKIIISLNYYLNTKPTPNNNFKLKGNYMYRDGILRMVSRSDQEWSDIFSKYFIVEKIDHFSWPGETRELRRLFYLVNSKN